MIKISTFIQISIICILSLSCSKTDSVSNPVIEKTSEVEKLFKHSEEFTQAIYSYENGIHAAVGYGIANSYLIEGNGLNIIIDATDNFKSRSTINRISLILKKPLVMGAAIKMQGQVAVFRNDLSNMPCYNCLYDDIDDEIDSCIDLGVLSMLTGVIGSLQATEVIKTLLNFGESLESKLLLVDLKHMGFRTIKITKDKKCKICN